MHTFQKFSLMNFHKLNTHVFTAPRLRNRTSPEFPLFSSGPSLLHSHCSWLLEGRSMLPESMFCSLYEWSHTGMHSPVPCFFCSIWYLQDLLILWQVVVHHSFSLLSEFSGSNTLYLPTWDLPSHNNYLSLSLSNVSWPPSLLFLHTSYHRLTYYTFYLFLLLFAPCLEWKFHGVR